MNPTPKVAKTDFDISPWEFAEQQTTTMKFNQRNQTNEHIVHILRTAFIALVASSFAEFSMAEDFPPGWLPVAKLDRSVSWEAFRKIDDRIHLYLPDKSKPVRGVFACFVFHSADPRELADLWNFAIVTVPWPFEYDLGHNDKRNGRYKLGHETQNMGLLLRYLEQAAKSTNHPELATTPIVGWLGQNGSRQCADLYTHASSRVLAWTDSFPNRLRQHPELTKAVPFAFAWEIDKKDLRSGDRSYKSGDEPVADLSCRATTYGFGHGIYSKFNFFMVFLDRTIALRMPSELPPAGEKVTLRPVVRREGWVGDFDPISSWNPISPANSDKANQAKYPVWLPDEYAAWAWRSYHSNCRDLEITGPKFPYSKRNGKWGGEGDCGMGYGGYLAANSTHTFAAKVKGPYERIEFHDGDQLLGEAISPKWELTGVKLKPGLRVLFAVGVNQDGSRSASRPAIVIVK